MNFSVSGFGGGASPLSSLYSSYSANKSLKASEELQAYNVSNLAHALQSLKPVEPTDSVSLSETVMSALAAMERNETALTSTSQSLVDDITNTSESVGALDSGLDDIAAKVEDIGERLATVADKELTTEDREQLQVEIDSIKGDINKAAEKLSKQIEAQSGVKISLDAKTLGVDDIDVRSPEAAEESVKKIDSALELLSNAKEIVGKAVEKLQEPGRLADMSKSMANLGIATGALRDVQRSLDNAVAERSEVELVEELGEDAIAPVASVRSNNVPQPQQMPAYIASAVMNAYKNVTYMANYR
ncbi:flagellin [Deferribacterales bacterium RsTz2092]|nr:hypothetical protein AGMMS49941_02200 [Deferribacterales bacterium]